MIDFFQGDIIRVSGYKDNYMIVSRNAFIRATNVFHISPVLNCPEGPTHIHIIGNNGIDGTVMCEQIKLIDPSVRSCSWVDRVPYRMIMEVSDVIQGIFEYD